MARDSYFNISKRLIKYTWFKLTMMIDIFITTVKLYDNKNIC